MSEKGSVRRLLLLSAVFSLAISVATRYGAVDQQKASTTMVKSQSLDASRQHLLNDSLHWSAPSATFVLFLPARILLAAWTGVPSVARLHFESFFHRRPPPFS
jgi:hypothetical protein